VCSVVKPGFNWSKPGYHAFMRANAKAIAEALEEKAQDIADAANAGVLGSDGNDFVVDVQLSSGRRKVPRVGIVAASFDAQQAEGSKRSLTRAVEANRG